MALAHTSRTDVVRVLNKYDFSSGRIRGADEKKNFSLPLSTIIAIVYSSCLAIRRISHTKDANMENRKSSHCDMRWKSNIVNSIWYIHNLYTAIFRRCRRLHILVFGVAEMHTQRTHQQ